MRKSTGPVGVLVAAVLLQVVQPSAPTPAAAPSCYVVSSLERVAPDAPLPVNPTAKIEIAAAANEYEAAQLIIHGGDGGITGADVTLAGPLTAANGASLDIDTVRFYREHYVRVTNRSGRSRQAARGVYPDALIPLRNPFTGESIGTGTYPAAPFDVAARANQPVYVEFFIPPGTQAGEYHGAVQVVFNGGAPLAEIPVSVRVWRFTLPTTPSLHTSFQSYDAEHWLWPAKYHGYGYQSSQHIALATAIDEMLIAHRLMPTTPRNAYFDVGPNGRIAPTLQQAERILHFLQRPGYTDFRIPFGDGFPENDILTVNRQAAKNYLQSALEWFRTQGVEGKMYLRPGDEPSTTAKFVEIRDTAMLAHEVDPSIRVGMTVALTGPKTQEYLLGTVNLLIAAYSDFDPAVAAERLAAGDEMWSYTALVQNSGQPSPYWQIDFPLLNYRVVNWINYRYGITGLLYWASSFWKGAYDRGTTPWADPRSACFGTTCYNGEGLLVYPGREVDLVVPKDAYGPYSPSAVYGPVPSLRIKALRDAMEDYEYLVMAASVDPDAAMARAVEVGCAGDPAANCFHHWNSDPAALLAARRALGEFIESTRPPRPATRAHDRPAPRSSRGR